MRAETDDKRTTPTWYVVQTARHREALADLSIREAGLETYLPMARQWPPPAVGGEIAPLFAGYVFVRLALPEDFHTAAWLPGVRSFVTFGDTPAPVADEVIHFLRDREGPDGIIRCGDAPSDVTITHGALKGFSAVVETRLSKRQRVVVLLDILQRPVRVEVPERWLKSA